KRAIAVVVTAGSVSHTAIFAGSGGAREGSRSGVEGGGVAPDPAGRRAGRRQRRGPLRRNALPAKGSAGEGLPGESFEGLDVAGTGLVDDFGRQGRRRGVRGLVPARFGGQPVADELLVEARLSPSRRIVLSVPEAGGIRGEHLVAEDDRAIGQRAELELRVGEYDAAFAGDGLGPLVDVDGQVAQLLRGFGADGLGDLSEADVLIVIAELGLRRGREDRRFEAIGLIESGGQSDAAHGPGG